MNQQQIMQEIASLLEIILEETETISGHQGKVPQIEIDLVMSNLQKLYQAYHDLNRINAREGGRPSIQTSVPETQPEEKPHPSIPMTPIQDLPPEVSPSNSARQEQASSANDENEKPDTSPIIPSPEVPHEQPRYTIPKRPADLQGLASSPTPSSEDPDKAKKKDPSPVKPTLADTLKNHQLSLHDKLENTQNGSTIAERLQQHRIQDLKTALGINERFLFINELFKGDSASFEEAVSSLNSFTGYPEAAIYLNHLAVRYSWEQEAEAYQTLVSILKRRYL